MSFADWLWLVIALARGMKNDTQHASYKHYTNTDLTYALITAPHIYDYMNCVRHIGCAAIRSKNYR